MFKSLQARFLIALIALSVIPLAVIAHQGYYSAYMAVEEVSRAHITSVLTARLTSLTEWVNERKAIMRVFTQLLADDPCAQDIERVGEILRAFRKKQPVFETLWVFDQNWDLLTSIGMNATAKDCTVGDSFKNMLKRAPERPLFVSERGEIGETGRVFLGAGIPQKNGPLCYLIGKLPLRAEFRRLLALQSGLGQSEKAYIIGKDGTYLLPPADFPELGGQPAIITNCAICGVTGTSDYTDHRGVPVVGICGEVPDLNWRLAVEMDQREALVWLRGLQARALVTGAVVLIIAFGVSLYTARLLADPFRKLSNTAVRIGAGDHAIRLKPEQMYSREARALAQTFNRMLDQIEEEHVKRVQQTSLAAVGEVASSIAHEMRNPLSSIKLNIDAIRTAVQSDPDYAELAQIAHEQAARLERMLSDLLAYGKPLPATRESLSVATLLQETLTLIEPQSTDTGVWLEVDVDAGASLHVSGDHDQLLQALINLVSNAMQASSANTVVRLQANTQTVDGREMACIAVLDEGTGISDAVHERLFEPFFTTRKEGTGLGLANVRKIAEHHGGRITAANHPGGGAVFTLAIPLLKETVA